MRIRKNASRLLGSASDPLPPPPPPPPPAISAADQDCSNACSSSSCSSVCQLNRSPWDLIDSKEEEHDGGIMGSHNEDPRVVLIREKREEKSIKCCSKRGKGWSCARPAEPSHNFCGHHLAKLRSSAAGRRRSAAPADGSRRNTRRRAPKESPPAASSGPSSYYYYGRFAPWQAKRRGGADVKVKEGISTVGQASGLDSEDEAENADSSRKNVAQSKSKSKKRAARSKMAEAASESNFYYYYGGFGPWRSKMRGKPAEDHESKAKDRIEGEEIVGENSDFDDGEEKMRELKDIESDQK